MPHVGQYPKACLLCPLICYTSDLLQCYSLCCMCFLQSADFPHLFSGSFGNLLIFVLQCIQLPESPVAHGQWFWGRGGMSCWRAGVLVLVAWHGHRQQPVCPAFQPAGIFAASAWECASMDCRLVQVGWGGRQWPSCSRCSSARSHPDRPLGVPAHPQRCLVTLLEALWPAPLLQVRLFLLWLRLWLLCVSSPSPPLAPSWVSSCLLPGDHW